MWSQLEEIGTIHGPFQGPDWQPFVIMSHKRRVAAVQNQETPANRGH